MALNSEESKEEKRRKAALQRQFNRRITIVKKGREAFLAKDYVNCMHNYLDYLKILCETKESEDIFKLNPTMFDDSTQLSELLLISHVYWEMARIYEMTPKLQDNFQKSLDQFVKFTINQPYQVLNAEMLRKYIKLTGKNSRLIDKFQEAHSHIFTNSKKCYIATHCFGDQHLVTHRLREFKQELVMWPYGLKLVELYYRSSSTLIYFLVKRKKLNLFFASIIKPSLQTFSLLTQTSIFRRCSYYLKLLRKNGSSL